MLHLAFGEHIHTRFAGVIHKILHQIERIFIKKKFYLFAGVFFQVAVESRLSAGEWRVLDAVALIAIVGAEQPAVAPDMPQSEVVPHFMHRCAAFGGEGAAAVRVFHFVGVVAAEHAEVDNHAVLFCRGCAGFCGPVVEAVGWKGKAEDLADRNAKNSSRLDLADPDIQVVFCVPGRAAATGVAFECREQIAAEYVYFKQPVGLYPHDFRQFEVDIGCAGYKLEFGTQVAGIGVHAVVVVVQDLDLV